MRVVYSLIACCLLAAFSQAQAALPPWFTLQLKMTESIGAHPGVRISPLQGADPSYFIDVNCSDDRVAAAHALILEPLQTFGNIRVSVRVFNSKGRRVLPNDSIFTGDPAADVEIIKGVFHTALGANPFFKQISRTMLVPVAVEIRPTTIQVIDDNISSPFFGTTFVAADVFAEVINETFFMGVYRAIVTSARKSPKRARTAAESRTTTTARTEVRS